MTDIEEKQLLDQIDNLKMQLKQSELLRAEADRNVSVYLATARQLEAENEELAKRVDEMKKLSNL